VKPLMCKYCKTAHALAESHKWRNETPTSNETSDETPATVEPFVTPFVTRLFTEPLTGAERQRRYRAKHPITTSSKPPITSSELHK
jgi:hypothetical protein